MPYYCTVPRCTSMAGKAKNVSFHQFPRDEELARLWNNILKRGKPYTKYSKVCSLHFTKEDYTITSAGKNKGQWRTLRKDAIPSQNLPSDSPAPYHHRKSGPWPSNTPSNIPPMDAQMQHQLAQAIYMQTMLAMQAAGVPDALSLSALCNAFTPTLPNSPTNEDSTQQDNSVQTDQDTETHSNETDNRNVQTDNLNNSNFQFQQSVTSSYKCDDCAKCFKDPDVFILHKRSHKSNGQTGKENFNLNIKPEMLRSNPILANLLKDTVEKNIFNTNLTISVASVDNYLDGNDYRDECDRGLSDSDNNESNLVIDEKAENVA